MAEVPEWKIKGELILNCNCTVFCPCVVSLGKHPPTEGYCQAWLGVRIDEGHYDGRRPVRAQHRHVDGHSRQHGPRQLEGRRLLR
jgi:hypothetical protein